MTKYKYLAIYLILYIFLVVGSHKNKKIVEKFQEVAKDLK